MGDLYEWVHQGHCADGWVRRSTRQTSIKGCFEECVNRGPHIGYFAYSNENNDCACYQQSAGCPDDNKFNNHNSYRIRPKGKIFPSVKGKKVVVLKIKRLYNSFASKFNFLINC